MATPRDSFRPRLLLAYADSAHAARTARLFRRRGWEVHQADNAAEARRLAAALEPKLLILDVDLPDESGWLTCAKVRLSQPRQRIALVGPEITPKQRRLGKFVGASVVLARHEELTALLRPRRRTVVPA